MDRHSLLPVLAVLLTSAAGCGSAAPAAAPAPAPVRAPTAAPAPAPADDRVRVQAGPVSVRAEVADDVAERATGLMRRRAVPPGTGMLFRYAAPVAHRFYMYDVAVPLTAVFALRGQVVGVLTMPPCTERQPSACPTYGPRGTFDTVLEAAPETLRGVREGDPLTVPG